jgi:hypothetical protein
MEAKKPAGTGPRRAVITAAILLWVVSNWVPFGRTLLYPLTLLTTWVHEMGHGLAALLVGGRFRELEIFANASGLAYTAAQPGWRDAMVSAGGLLAPPILGTVILALVHGPRRAKIFLTVISAALVLSLVIWVRSSVGLLVVPLLAALFGWAAWGGWKEKPERRVMLSQVIGVVLAVDTLTRMVSYVFKKEVEVDGQKRLSDIARIAEQMGGHYALWGVVITVVALGLLAFGAWRALRKR